MCTITRSGHANWRVAGMPQSKAVARAAVLMSSHRNALDYVAPVAQQEEVTQ